MPSFNVPDDEKPSFNKKVKESLDILSKDVDGTLNRLRSFQPETLVESYNSPNEDPSVRDLSPLEQYFYEPQPVAEVADLTALPQQESMVVPQEQPKVLSNLVNQYESGSNQDMVSVTPYGQEALDAFGSYADSLRDESGKVVGSALDVFAQPLDENKVKALGYVDNDMRPTEKGELFYNLVNAGMFNDNGTITEKGQAYMTPTRDVGKPENLKAFKILWDDEVIRSNASWGEIGAGTVNLLKDAAFGGGERLGQEAQSLWANSQTWAGFVGRQDLRSQALKDKMTASGLGLVEGVVENLAGYIGLIDLSASFVANKIDSVLPVGADGETEEALYQARQRQWQNQEDIENLNAGEIAQAVLGITGATKEAEEVKNRIGENEFNRQYGETKAFSQFVDPVNLIPIGAAVNAAKAAPLASRIAITAQRRLGKIAAQDFLIANATTAIEAGNSVLKKEALAYSIANRLSSEIAQRAVNNPELIARSNQAAQVASRITEEANKIRTALPTLTDDLANMVAKRNSMATRIPETYYKKVLGTMELGRQLRSMPAKKIGAAFERVGETISKTDNAVSNFLQERGLDQMYTAAVGAAGIVGLAGNPVIGVIGAGAAILKTGKVLSNYGKLFRYVGKEMENARGQIPFWKRVARHTEPGSLNRGIAHTFNTFDLGGATSDILRRTGRGVLAAAPSDLMFEYLSDGADMRPETFYQAASESLVLGGSFAAGGGAFMGTKKRMRELSIGDELNFRRDMTDPRQKGLFELIPSSTRRAIATYSIANPTLNYVFKDSGASRYDINSNTAIINVNSTNPIKALVAHETLHHTIIKNNMESGISVLFLGDTKTNTVGGLFRSKDGKLDPNFEAFKNGYYKRLGIDDMPNAERDAIYSLEKIAVEYFIEKHADQYAEMAESGKLGAVSASGAVKRKMSSILETVLPRIPVLKDLHFKSGGMIDANGSWVTGNGILDSEGVKRDPLTARMFRDMNRRSSGLAPGQFNPLMSDNEDSGASIFLDPANEIDAELLHPQVKVDENGKPIRQNGQLVAIDKSTELSRALAGLTAIEVLRRKREANYAPEKGEAYVNDEGEFQPGWLSADVITEMFAKNNHNPEQKRIIREVNRLIRKGSGDRMVMVNFPATGRNKAGKVVYKPQKATLRDTVPVAVTVSKDGNLLIGLMSVTKLQENISKRAQSKRGKKLYSGNIDLILQDTQAMMDFHKSGTDSIEYFKARYGAVEADERKKFINTMFGLLNQKEQAALNPILLEDGVKSRDNVYRTYRADRVSKAVAMSPEDYPSMPFSYEAVSQVKMPEPASTRYLPESLSASKKKYAPSDETESKAFASATKNKRSGELAVAAVRLDKGIISNEEFSNMVEIFDPFVVKGVEAIPSIERVKKYIVDRSSGRDLTEKQKEKIKKVKENLDIAEGELVDYRIDIPTYNVSMKAGEPTYAITGHKPGGSAKADEVIGYTSIARIKNVKVVTRVEKGNPMTIAQGGGKFPLATVRGNNVKINRLPADINDPKVWSEIAYNPSRSSEFVDVRTKMPVQSADDAIMVGSRVFMKNPVYDSKPNYGQPRVDASGKQTGVIDKRYLPEGKYDRETAIKNKDVLAKRFENFKPQVGFDGLNVGWQRPSDGKFVDTNEHHNFYREDGGNQLGDPIEIGYVRIVREGKTLYYEGKPNPKQLRELKDTSIELGLTLVGDNDTTRYLPEGNKLKLLQTKKTLADWATTQESWKDWYSEHQEILDDFFGDYAGLFQEILAVTSQAASVKANVGLALKAFGQLMRNEDFDGKLRGLEKSGYLPAVIKNLNAIKNSTQVGGRKISNYKLANEGDSSKVVVDRHIARMLFGVDTPSAKQYAKAESVLSDIAKQLGWKPAQVQAALWAHSIVMSGKDPVSYGGYLKSLESKKLTKKDLINGIKGNQITKRIGEVNGSSYGGNEFSKERGRYSPSSKNVTKGNTVTNSKNKTLAGQIRKMKE